MSLFPSHPNGQLRSRARSPPPRVVAGVPDPAKTRVLEAADLFQTQFSRRSGMTLVSHEQDAYNELLHSFYFQDKQQTLSQDKVYKLVAQVIPSLSSDVRVVQSEDREVRVFRIDLSAEDLLRVRPELFQVLRHPQVQTTVVYLLVFVSIATLSLYWL